MKNFFAQLFYNNKIRVFFLFLILSSGSLILNKLSKEYKTTLQFNVVISNLPSDKILLKTDFPTINIYVKASGYNLIGYGLLNKKININAAKVTKLKNNTYVVNTNILIDEIQQQLLIGTEIIEILNPMLEIELGEIISKKIPVILKKSISYEKGYKIKGELKIEPDSVIISGPENYVNTIQFIETKFLKKEKIYSTLIEEVPLNLKILPNTVKASAEVVNIAAEVEKFTELAFTIPFKVINNTEGLKIETFPSKVEVIFQLELSEISKLNASNFEVVGDLEYAKINKLTYLVPKITKKPSGIQNIYIKPSKVDFIIRK